MALPHQFSNYNHHCIQLWLHILSASIRVWQATVVVLESSNEKHFNEGTLYSGVSRVKGTNKGIPSAKGTGRKECYENPEGAGSYKERAAQ